MRRILVTSALPNANGPVHLGHLLEHIQTDIWVRYQRMLGNECIYVCADDTHGTATMLAAEQANKTPEQLIDDIREEHISDFRAFNISYQNYYSTHSEENRFYLEFIYQKLREGGYIITQDEEQLFDPERSMFLADRNVRGTCPRCKAEDQPGDNCDACGATYEAMELIEPYSVISNAKPVIRSSQRYYVDLAQYTEFLRSWTASGTVVSSVANKLKEWLDAGLNPWDISRDKPYFGFPIPDIEDKFFYVWLDAPIGYMASFKNWCMDSGVEFDDFWKADSNCELHHFIGKDVINFHALFWPAVLSSAGFRTPSKVHVHGFVTMNGQKMSKSRGTFVNASTYLEFFDPDYLRYYFASRLTSNPNDIDFATEHFMSTVNSDLVGKLVNIASRCAGFIERSFDGMLADTMGEEEFWTEFLAAKSSIADDYESGDFSRVLRTVMALADKCNQYLAAREPWNLIKDPATQHEAHSVCSLGINVYRLLIIYLKPVIPSLVERSEEFLNVTDLKWSDLDTPLLSHSINKFNRLLSRIEEKSVTKFLEALKNSDTADSTHVDTAEFIDIEDFLKVKLRVARILKAEIVDGADKLLRLTLDVGDHERTVLSGIRSAYDPTTLVGRHTVVVANLAPRTMKFGTSDGMILAAGSGGSEIFLLAPDDGAEPGMEVR